MKISKGYSSSGMKMWTDGWIYRLTDMRFGLFVKIGYSNFLKAYFLSIWTTPLWLWWHWAEKFRVKALNNIIQNQGKWEKKKNQI